MPTWLRCQDAPGEAAPATVHTAHHDIRCSCAPRGAWTFVLSVELDHPAARLRSRGCSRLSDPWAALTTDPARRRARANPRFSRPSPEPRLRRMSGLGLPGPAGPGSAIPRLRRRARRSQPCGAGITPTGTGARALSFDSDRPMAERPVERARGSARVVSRLRRPARCTFSVFAASQLGRRRRSRPASRIRIKTFAAAHDTVAVEGLGFGAVRQARDVRQVGHLSDSHPARTFR